MKKITKKSDEWEKFINSNLEYVSKTGNTPHAIDKMVGIQFKKENLEKTLGTTLSKEVQDALKIIQEQINHVYNTWENVASSGGEINDPKVLSSVGQVKNIFEKYKTDLTA